MSTSVRELAHAMLRAGRSDAQVAAALQLHPGTPAEWRRELGLPPAPRPARERSVRSERVRLIECVNDMLMDGRSRAQICVELGISLRTLERYIRPEMRGRPWRFSPNSRRVFAQHMREVQPLGAAASRGIGFGRAG